MPCWTCWYVHMSTQGTHGEGQCIGQEGDMEIVGIGSPLLSREVGMFSSMAAPRLGPPDPVIGSYGAPAFMLVDMNA